MNGSYTSKRNKDHFSKKLEKVRSGAKTIICHAHTDALTRPVSLIGYEHGYMHIQDNHVFSVRLFFSPC